MLNVLIQVLQGMRKRSAKWIGIFLIRAASQHQREGLRESLLSPG